MSTLGCDWRTRLLGGTERVSQTFPPITEPRPMVIRPRIVAPEVAVLVCREAARAKRDRLVDAHAVADDRGLADDDAGTVIDEEAFADRRAGVDVDAGP